MKKILINILSEQAFPNIRFIKEFFSQIDHYYFLSTVDMIKEKKLDIYISSLNLSPSKVIEIEVDPFNISKIEEKLLQYDLNEDDYYIVNITGGTKPMSIATLSFFSAFPNASIYYVPIAESFYRQIFPRHTNAEIEFTTRITLKEYFNVFNLKVLRMEHQHKLPIKNAQNQMREFLQEKGDINNMPKIAKAHLEQKPVLRSYYSGGWFEEYIYWLIKDKFNLNNKEIAFNVFLQNGNSKNEYDVIFLLNGNIYIIECKAYFGNANIIKKIEKDLYKLGALYDDFGLKAEAVFITTYDLNKTSGLSKKNILNRAKTLGIKIFDYDNLVNMQFLKNI